MALEAELALTQKVLDTMAAKEDSALGEVLDQPLCMLHTSTPRFGPEWVFGGVVGNSLDVDRALPPPSLPCTLGPVSHSPPLLPTAPCQTSAHGGPRPRGRLPHWLPQLQEVSKKARWGRGRT